MIHHGNNDIDDYGEIEGMPGLMGVYLRHSGGDYPMIQEGDDVLIDNVNYKGENLTGER